MVSFPLLRLPLLVIVMYLIMCGDVELNPGPLDKRELLVIEQLSIDPHANPTSQGCKGNVGIQTEFPLTEHRGIREPKTIKSTILLG